MLHMTVSVLGSYKLWLVPETVQDSGCQLMVHSCSLELVSQKHRLDGVEGTGDSHCAAGLLGVKESTM